MTELIVPAEAPAPENLKVRSLDRFSRGILLKLLERIERGRLVIADGSERVAFGRVSEALPLEGVITVHHQRFYGDCLFRGTIGAGESYVAGFWSADYLTAVVRNFALHPEVFSGMDTGMARIMAPVVKTLHALNKNTRAGSRRNIVAHYDLGNDFYRLCRRAKSGPANSATQLHRMNLKLRVQLSAMMFFQFFIWSVWFVTMGPYLREVLKFTPQQIGWAYTATGWAAFVSPFFVGMVADRFFATQRIMAVLHILGGLCMFAVSRATTFGWFLPLLIGHTLCFMPTLALDTLAMKQMTDPGKQFSRVAVLGTIGWIVAGQILGLFGAKSTTTPISFQLACGVSLVMGLYSLTLPHTPPKGAGQPMTAPGGFRRHRPPPRC